MVNPNEIPLPKDPFKGLREAVNGINESVAAIQDIGKIFEDGKVDQDEVLRLLDDVYRLMKDLAQAILKGALSVQKTKNAAKQKKPANPA